MGEANENRFRTNSSSGSSRRAMEGLYLEINRHPSDLLQRFMSSDAQQHKTPPSEEEDKEEIELNLGLSLGGRFGVDKTVKKLTRASSIAGSIPLLREHDVLSTSPISHPVLMRTSSLPTGTEEEWRKRKEMQSLRRMEAKRRRSEKQKNLNGSLREELNLDEERRELLVNRGNWTPAWVRQGVIGAMNVNRGSNNLQGLAGQQQGSIGSVESQGRSSSGMSEMETRKDSHSCVHAAIHIRERPYGYISGQVTLGFGGDPSLDALVKLGIKEGTKRNSSALLVPPLWVLTKHACVSSWAKNAGSSSVGEARSSSSNQSLQERSNHEAASSSGAKTNENVYGTSGPELENPSRKFDSSENRGREIGANAMEDMPCVFTKGDGPNGRRIEGILYKYSKGGDVRIMCICHGSFHSPAEFVKHAGGGNVDHPLRHIVVNPSGNSFS